MPIAGGAWASRRSNLRPDKHAELLNNVGKWIDGRAKDDVDAATFDNPGSWLRRTGLITKVASRCAPRDWSSRMRLNLRTGDRSKSPRARFRLARHPSRREPRTLGSGEPSILANRAVDLSRRKSLTREAGARRVVDLGHPVPMSSTGLWTEDPPSTRSLIRSPNDHPH